MSLPANVSAAVQNELRLAALHQCALLDSPSRVAFDRLARLAARLLCVPVALVSLVDADRQFFVSCPGLAEPWASQRETPLPHSFCQYIVASGEPLVVSDARQHPFLADNLAIPDLGVVAYLGFPLTTSDGFVLGSFCAIDSVPRSWNEEDIATLRDLSAAVITEIELRRDMLVRERIEAALYESNARFAGAFADAAIGMALIAPNGRWLQVNQSLCVLVGYSEREMLGIDFQTITHPDDLNTDLGYVKQMLTGERKVYQMEKRYIHKQGHVVWVLLNVSLVCAPSGQPLYFISQIQDITARKQAQREREELIDQLREALDSVKVLQGLLPICAGCKKIRDDGGYWNEMEVYIQRHTNAHFSHGICPHCVQQFYPELADVPADELQVG